MCCGSREIDFFKIDVLCQSARVVKLACKYAVKRQVYNRVVWRVNIEKMPPRFLCEVIPKLSTEI